MRVGMEGVRGGGGGGGLDLERSYYVNDKV